MAQDGCQLWCFGPGSSKLSRQLYRYQETNQAVSRCNFCMLVRVPLPVVAIAQAIAQSFAWWFRWSSVGFPNLKTMFILMMTVMFMGGGWRVKWSSVGYGYFIGLPGSWHHRIYPCHADEFHLVSIMSICIVKLSLYCKANSGNNWLVRFLMVLERRTRAHVNNSSSTCKRGIRIVENSRCKHQPIKAKKRSTLDDPSGQVEPKWNKGMRKAP